MGQSFLLLKVRWAAKLSPRVYKIHSPLQFLSIVVSLVARDLCVPPGSAVAAPYKAYFLMAVTTAQK